MIAVLVIALAGWAWGRRLDPDAGLLEAVLAGGAVAAVALLALDLVGVRWSAASLVIALVLLCKIGRAHV